MNNDEKEILDEKLVRLRQLSKNLDESFTIPGTNIIFSMLVNILLDTTIGIIPVAGDIFDIFWKSNKRNLKIIEKHLANKR